MSKRSSRRDASKEKYWRKIVSKQQKSGSSIRAFCQNEQINEPTFYAWRRELKLRDRESGSDDQPEPAKLTSQSSFVPLTVIGNPAADSMLVIQLANGHQLKVPAGFDCQTLKDVIAVLEQSAC